MTGRHRWHDDTEDDNAETAVSPVLFGVDLHPSFQAGITIEALPASGIAFMACKVSEGTDSSYMSAGSADWLRRAKAIGLAAAGYHYLHPGNEDAQAKVFSAQLQAAGVPGMVDAEALTTGAVAASPGGSSWDSGGLGQMPEHRGETSRRADALSKVGASPTLTVAGIAGFLSRVRAYGGFVPLAYVPHWYWAAMGSPSLTGLPTLWASSYPSSAAGTPQQLYAAVTPDRWAGYGGQSVAVLQFAETGRVANYSGAVDLDAFLGTRDQLAALLGQPSPLIAQRRRMLEDQAMHVTTPAPADWSTAKSTWPQQWVSFGFDPPGGWGGDGIVKVTFSAPGGWIADGAWWQRPGTGVGTSNAAHGRIDLGDIPGGQQRYQGYQLELLVPPRCDELELLIAAPSGAHFSAYYAT